MVGETPSQSCGEDVIAFYRDVFDRRTANELSTIARAKRFREWFIADQAFREALADKPETAAAEFRKRGLEIDPDSIRPLWDVRLAEQCKEEKDFLAAWPAAKAWKDWIGDILRHRDMMLAHGNAVDVNPRFSAWRRRQMARAGSELGKRHNTITHPVAAYELSSGCTVGCWFCAISAERFESYFPYTPENAALWRGTLQTMVDLFGDACQTGFCYWATDPMDNPDYPKFIEDHHEITGWLPQTTTAAPLKDPALTAEVMALYERRRCVMNRFSITTPRMLKQVHETFTPDELLGVELVLHTKGSLVSKAVAGRVYERRERARAEGREDPLVAEAAGMGTIACVSGFLVNMPERKVRLVAPCIASKRWPLGYRVYAEATFSDVVDYRARLEEMIETRMPPSLPGGEIAAFREDLRYEPRTGCFVLSNDLMEHKVSGHDFIRALGDLIAQGDLTAGAVSKRLVEAGHDIFTVSGVLQDLFDLGLVEPPWPRLPARPASALERAS